MLRYAAAAQEDYFVQTSGLSFKGLVLATRWRSLSSVCLMFAHDVAGAGQIRSRQRSEALGAEPRAVTSHIMEIRIGNHGQSPSGRIWSFAHSSQEICPGARQLLSTRLAAQT